jgi:hypothetical protein
MKKSLDKELRRLAEIWNRRADNALKTDAKLECLCTELAEAHINLADYIKMRQEGKIP